MTPTYYVPLAVVLYWLSEVSCFEVLHAFVCLMRTQFLDYLFFFQNGLDFSFVLLTLRSFVLQLCHPESEHKCSLCSQIENWNWTFDSCSSVIRAIIGIICVLLDNNFKVTYCGPAHDPVHSLSSTWEKNFGLVW